MLLIDQALWSEISSTHGRCHLIGAKKAAYAQNGSHSSLIFLIRYASSIPIENTLYFSHFGILLNRWLLSVYIFDGLRVLPLHFSSFVLHVQLEETQSIHGTPAPGSQVSLRPRKHSCLIDWLIHSPPPPYIIGEKRLFRRTTYRSFDWLVTTQTS